MSRLFYCLFCNYYLRRRTERAALLDEEDFMLFGFFSFTFDERFVERLAALVLEVLSVVLFTSVESFACPASAASFASRAAMTSSRDGTQSFFSKSSRRRWMLS